MKMNRKFTQEELEEALEQIRQQNRKIYQQAQRAIEWLVEQGVADKTNFSIRPKDPWCINVEVVDPEVALVLMHQSHGPYLKDFKKRLDTAEFAKSTDTDYEVITPFGLYELRFEYIDQYEVF